ncbi:MAG: hypothetical protein ACOC4Z_02510 [Patescibacteria group bacterium]
MFLPTLILAAALSFPIPQLGNCQSVKDCKTYCDLPENYEACTQFAEEHNIGNGKASKRYILVNIEFPIKELDNCASLEECKELCYDPSNYEACTQLAKNHSIATIKNSNKGYLLENVRFPIPELGSCSSLKDCRDFCNDPQNRDKCLQFVENYKTAGPGRERGESPPIEDLQFPISELGNCASPEECREYCNKHENREACQEFTEERGLTAEDREEVRDRHEAIEFPIKELGNCGSREECEEFCRQPENREICQRFTEERGLEDKERQEEGRGGRTEDIKFPIDELGNCGSKEECEEFCNRPENRDECRKFSVEHGLEAPQQERKIEGPGGCTTPEECDAYCSDPSHQEECMQAFEEFCKNNPDLEECKNGPPQQKAGPGGCTTPEECEEYCRNNPNDEDCLRSREEYCKKHPEECESLAGPGGCTTPEECKEYCQNNPNDPDCEMMNEEKPAGPGGCTSPEECKEYCQNNPNDPDCEMMNEEKPAGPGGCATPEECKEYCKNNPDDPDCKTMTGEKMDEPEGCSTPEECKEYCQENPNDPACETMTKETLNGPGGCTTPEECKEYCQNNPDDPDCPEPKEMP